jgi:DNA-binding response OmpR family regulator
MNGSRLVLVVDDEPGVRDVAQMYLAREGFRVVLAADGPDALAAVEREPPDLIILDLMLPGLDGFEVCRRLRRASDVPIIMLTARDEDVDVIVGLELGADDYITKPFNPRELVARARAVLRRTAADRSTASAPTPAAAAQTIQVRGLAVNPAGRTAALHGQPLKLTPREFDLLLTLVRHRGQALSREQLLEQAWGYDFAGGTRTVDMHVAQLRKKLAATGHYAPDVTIATVQRVGYRLEG